MLSERVLFVYMNVMIVQCAVGTPTHNILIYGDNKWVDRNGNWKKNKKNKKIYNIKHMTVNYNLVFPLISISTQSYLKRYSKAPYLCL